MEESLAALIDACEPGASAAISGLDTLVLESKYVPALEPNPALIRLFYRKLTNSTHPPKASLCILHGFGEHSGKYLRSAALFALSGYEVHLIDQRNAGLSGGPRGHGDLFEFAKDVNKLMQLARTDLPCYLWGHSQGGLLATYIVQNNAYLRLAGLVITNPLYSLVKPVPAFMTKVLPFLADFLPFQAISGSVVTSNLSRDDSYLFNLFEDPFAMPYLGLKHVSSMMTLMNSVVSNGKALLCPLYLLHSKKDGVTCHQVSAQFFESVASADKQIVLGEAAFHEQHHDLEKDQFIADIVQWMDARLEKAKPLSIVGSFKTQAVVRKSGGWGWRVVGLLLVIYVVGVLRFKAALGVGVVRAIVYGALPKLLWPLFLLAGLVKR